MSRTGKFLNKIKRGLGDEKDKVYRMVPDLVYESSVPVVDDDICGTIAAVSSSLIAIEASLIILPSKYHDCNFITGKIAKILNTRIENVSTNLVNVATEVITNFYADGQYVATMGDPFLMETEIYYNSCFGEICYIISAPIIYPEKN